MQNTEQKRYTMKPAIVNARYSKVDSYTKQLTTQLSETTNLNGTEIIQLHEFEVLSHKYIFQHLQCHSYHR